MIFYKSTYFLMSCSQLTGNPSVIVEAFFSLQGYAASCSAFFWGALSHLSMVVSTEVAIVCLPWSFQSWLLSAHFCASHTEWWFAFCCWALLQPQPSSHLPRSPLHSSGALSPPWGAPWDPCSSPTVREHLLFILGTLNSSCFPKILYFTLTS